MVYDSYPFPETVPAVAITRQPQQIINIYVNAPAVPNACQLCSNHPSNGGSGICHCILGSQTVTC